MTVDVIEEIGSTLDLDTTALEHHRPGKSYESQTGAAKAQMDIVHSWKKVVRLSDAGWRLPLLQTNSPRSLLAYHLLG